MNRFVYKHLHYVLNGSLVHDLTNKTFKREIINIKGNFIIKIEYKKIGDLFVLYHTEVPKEHRGHNLGFLIAQEVFDYLIAQNIKSAIYCPFLLKFRKKYPDTRLDSIIEKLSAIDLSV